jgi:CheY-like chemotaxis protein
MTEQRKLLVVDDSQTSRQVIRNYVLKNRRTWVQYESDNALDALDMIRMVSPDFITMDVNMPNMSGLEAAERIVKQYPHIKITLITANIQESVRLRAIELGLGFIEKPIKEAGILDAIEFFERNGSNV